MTVILSPLISDTDAFFRMGVVLLVLTLLGAFLGYVLGQNKIKSALIGGVIGLLLSVVVVGVS